MVVVLHCSPFLRSPFLWAVFSEEKPAFYAPNSYYNDAQTLLCSAFRLYLKAQLNMRNLFDVNLLINHYLCFYNTFRYRLQIA